VAEPSEVRYANSGDLRIAWRTVGDGPIDLAFVPGFVSHLEGLWEYPPFARPLERLAEFSRLILLDKREQGLSDRVGRPPTLEESMQDLRAVLDAAGSERAAIFGISEGGPMAMLLAATHPDRVSHLVLYGTYARLGRAPDYPAGIPEQASKRWEQALRDEWADTPGMSLLAPTLLGNAEGERAWGRFIRMGTSPGGASALMGLYRELDVREALRLISQPTLVIQREGDDVVRAPHAQYMAERIPNARLLTVPGDDHAFYVGDTDVIVDAVEEFLTGTRRVRPPARVLSTVLFTDIVGSTEQAASLGDRGWRELLDRHDAIVRRAIAAEEGSAIKSTGDGFLATFTGPARGISAARSIVEQLRPLDLDVRAGLHTGEVELRDSDVGGMAVHIGARVAASAGPGEVLVSSTVKDLVVGSGIEFDDRGSAELKGVPGEWRLYAVSS
jgi:pimeloyl-ACP methyl ester carboxylesterase